MLLAFWWSVHTHTHKHTHTRLTALFPGLTGLPRWAGTRKIKPMWVLLKQEAVSGSGISWAICKSASRSRQITTPAPHHSSFFTGRMPFLPPNQQRQSTEGTAQTNYIFTILHTSVELESALLQWLKRKTNNCYNLLGRGLSAQWVTSLCPISPPQQR